MMPISLSDPEEPFIYTTKRNTIVVVENENVEILDAGTGQICISLSDLAEILSVLASVKESV